jgi:hypothetical protein
MALPLPIPCFCPLAVSRHCCYVRNGTCPFATHVDGIAEGRSGLPMTEGCPTTRKDQLKEPLPEPGMRFFLLSKMVACEPNIRDWVTQTGDGAGEEKPDVLSEENEEKNSQWGEFSEHNTEDAKTHLSRAGTDDESQAKVEKMSSITSRSDSVPSHRRARSHQHLHKVHQFKVTKHGSPQRIHRKTEAPTPRVKTIIQGNQHSGGATPRDNILPDRGRVGRKREPMHRAHHSTRDKRLTRHPRWRHYLTRNVYIDPLSSTHCSPSHSRQRSSSHHRSHSALSYCSTSRPEPPVTMRIVSPRPVSYASFPDDKGNISEMRPPSPSLSDMNYRSDGYPRHRHRHIRAWSVTAGERAIFRLRVPVISVSRSTKVPWRVWAAKPKRPRLFWRPKWLQ